MRWLLPILLLSACAPVRETGLDDDDDATAPEPTIEERYQDLEPGTCAGGWSADPAAQTPPLPGDGGEGTGTYGLWYAVECRVDPPVGLISFTLDWFDLGVPNIDVPITSVSINDVDEDHDPRDAELIDAAPMHFEENDYEVFSGWWEGEAEFLQDDDTPISLLWLVFSEAPSIGVAGR